MLPILSPETEDAMLRACVRELGPALWPFILVDDRTDEPRLVTGVRWLHRGPDGDTTEVVVLPREAVTGASSGQLVFRPELTVPPGAADGSLVLEPFLDGWLTRDGAELVVLPTSVLDGWVAGDEFVWQTASVGEDDPDGPAPDVTEPFACIVFGTTLAGDGDQGEEDDGPGVETGGVLTTCNEGGRLALEQDEGLLGALVLRLTGPFDALSVVLHGLVTSADGGTLRCTSARRIEQDLTATLGSAGRRGPEGSTGRATLGELGAAKLPFQVVDGTAPRPGC